MYTGRPVWDFQLQTVIENRVEDKCFHECWLFCSLLSALLWVIRGSFETFKGVGGGGGGGGRLQSTWPLVGALLASSCSWLSPTDALGRY